MWCVAELDEEYIQRMEDILAVYEKPLSEREPVVCVDEKPVVLHQEISRQCLGRRRIGDRASLRREARAWSRLMNHHRVPIRWAFTRRKARTTFDYTIMR